MDAYYVLIVLICLSAAFAYINHKFIKLPFVIGLFFLSTILSLIILGTKFWTTEPSSNLKLFVEQSNISKFILNIMLGFLLFAGSLHTNWLDLKKQLLQITVLALGGVILSTVIIAGMFYQLSVAFNLNIDFVYCLLFGALISPTDPIAVIGILTKAKVPKKLEHIIVGESLFNDGIGVVMFIALLEALQAGGTAISFPHVGMLFIREAVGGVIWGLILGFVLHHVLKSIDHYETEILLTLAFVMAGYESAIAVHVSGPLAMVIMGLLVGSYNTSLTHSDISQEHVNRFWQVVDVILNAILFILIALVMFVINFKAAYVFIGLISILVVLLSRVFVVYLSKIFLPEKHSFNRKEANLLIWGGLRGGLSIAMVLSLPNSEARDLLLIATYFCVLFSILIQGLSISRLARSIV